MPIDSNRDCGKVHNDQRDENTKDKPNGNSQAGERRSFQKELQTDVPRCRAERASQADLRSALTHDEQHQRGNANHADRQEQDTRR